MPLTYAYINVSLLLFLTALALASKLAGVESLIVVPKNASQVKVSKCSRDLDSVKSIQTWRTVASQTFVVCHFPIGVAFLLFRSMRSWDVEVISYSVLPLNERLFLSPSWPKSVRFMAIIPLK